MLQGLYSAAAGMAAQQQRLDAVSNDLSNVSTAGYKSQRVSFRDLAYTAAPTGQGVRAGAGAAMTVIGRSSAQGALQRTDEPLDVAVGGPGFLSVRRADGSQGLTRAGALRLDTDRQLTLPTGERLQPPIRLPRDVEPGEVNIATDGTVRAGDRRLGRIAIVDVPNPQNLMSMGNNVFTPTAGSGAPRAAQGATLQQGVLEASNVNTADAMTDLMDAQRSFTLASRAVQTQDQLMEIANGVKR